VRSAGREAVNLSAWPNPYRLWHHEWPLQPGQALDTGDWQPELAVWVESGAMDALTLPVLRCPVAGWFIDSLNPRKLGWHEQVARTFDYVFVAHRGFVEQVSARAMWLPLACDPEIHAPRALPTEPAWDIAYVGNRYSGGMYSRRFEALRDLTRVYRVRVASGVYFEKMADVYGNARIGWNMSLTGGDAVMRVFEVLCSGRPLLTDHAPASGVTDLFQVGELLQYRDEADMFGLADWLLTNPDEAAAIGAAGRAAVLAAHTYQCRAQALLEAVGG
jgi:spore maturation protein CgeB